MDESHTTRIDTHQNPTEELNARIARVQQTNARLRIGVVAMGALIAGVLLGGFTQPRNSVVAYTATDETMYRIYESGKIEYLRLDEDPPRTADGIFNWGIVKIDDRYDLRDRP
ncbi:MAG: hypothetical protein AB8C13_07360 [Phycisphaerales bacterium]